MIYSQIFDILDIGIVILDSDLKVYKWNRWMEVHSGLSQEAISYHSIFDYFPNLNNPNFLRSCKYVLGFGNLYFFSQKLHNHLFPFKPVSTLDSRFKFMQQSCNMGPLRDENKAIKWLYITVHDVTEIAIYEQKLIEVNMKDGLTGIFNRRFLEQRLKEEFAKTKRYSTPFSIIMMDIDFFKKVNDNYGHLCGDFILKSVSAQVAKMIRDTDMIARYGGEEFCCMLPETNMEGAIILAERCRKAIEEQEFIFQGTPIKVTISLGLAEMQEGVDSPDNLIKQADVCLYKAKESGRNRVVY